MHNNILSLYSPFSITLSPPSPTQAQATAPLNPSSPNSHAQPQASGSLTAPSPRAQAADASHPAPTDLFQPICRRLDWHTGAVDDGDSVATPFNIPYPSSTPPPQFHDENTQAAVHGWRVDLTVWPPPVLGFARPHAAPSFPAPPSATPAASAAPLYHSPLLTRAMRRAINGPPILPPPLLLDQSSAIEPASTAPARHPTKRQRVETKEIVYDGKFIGRVAVRSFCISIMQHDETLYVSVAHFCRALGVAEGNSKREFRKLTADMTKHFGRRSDSNSGAYLNYVTLAGAQAMAANREKPDLGEELERALADSKFTS